MTLLEIIVPAVCGKDTTVQSRLIVFEGKQDLEKQLARRLRGQLNPKARFTVLRDQDQADCRKVKRKLQQICTVRIACSELEALYLSDLRAVELDLIISGLAARQNRAKYRDPDHLAAPAKELNELTRRR